MNLTPSPKQQFFGNNGRPLVGGLVYTYVAGTNTKIDTYSDEGGTLNTNPIVLDFRGEANIWLDPQLTYKFVLSPAGDSDPPANPIWSVDDVAGNLTLSDITQQFLGQIIYPRTLAEITAGVTPTHYIYPEGDVLRYGAVGDNATDNSTPFQNAINVKAEYSGGVVTIPEGTFKFGTGLSVSAGVSMEGQGEHATILSYTGASIAITTEDVFGVSPFINYTSLVSFKLMTSTGATGIRIAPGGFMTFESLDVRGFSTSGVNLFSSTGKGPLYITFYNCHISENDIGLLVTGVNGFTNVITLVNCSIRANETWNIYSDQDCYGWNITGGSYEAGGTSGSGGAMYLNGFLGLSITGSYFEQTGGAAGLTALDISNTRVSSGISITGCILIGSTTGTAIKFGTSSTLKGGVVSGNEFSSWSIGINPQGALAGVIGPNSYDSVTTPVATPGSSDTGLVVYESAAVKSYGAPLSQFKWNGSAWDGFPAFRYTTVPIGSVAYGSFGTDTTTVNGTIYVAEVFIGAPMTLTGAGILSGSVGGGADKYIVALYSPVGALLANSALAGSVFGATNALQQIPFTATYDAAPGRYMVIVQANGATGRIRTISANTFINVRTRSFTGVFGTLPSFSAPTTFTADVGPIAYVY